MIDANNLSNPTLRSPMIDIHSPTYLVGDVHGKLASLMQTLAVHCISQSSIIILGDVGLGFHPSDADKLHYCDALLEEGGNHLYLIRGNHDKPQLWSAWKHTFKHIHFLQDAQRLTIDKKLYVVYGGAVSVDRSKRVKDVDYWAQEPFTPPTEAIPKLYGVLAHTGPFAQGWGGIMDYIRRDAGLRDDLSREQDDVAKTISLLHPKRWYCGHFHMSESLHIESCECRCLDIAEILRIS